MQFTSTSRRAFLRSVGGSLALPLLESTGILGEASELTNPLRRMVAMNFALGLHGPNFFPEQAGHDYAITPYLEAIGEDLRDRLTVFNGTSHPDVTLGHASDSTFLTAARFPGAPTFRNSISLDQLLVEKLRPDTRFPSLALGTRSGTISFSRSGVVIPLETKPSTVFSKMFVNGTKSEVKAQVQRLEEGRSVKDVADPNDDMTRLKLMLDLVYLGLQTDSTRFVTLYVGGSNSVQPIPGVSIEYHSLSHHGQDPEKLAQLKIIQGQQMEAVGELLRKLKNTQEGGRTLLDHTAVMFGSAMGNASSHNCKNLPIALAGGGFRHGQNLQFDQNENTPLCRLYVSMLQWLGVETDQFGSGKGTLPNLEFTS